MKENKIFAGFHFVRCFYAFLVWFSNVIFISVGRVLSEKPNRQTKRLENVFTCDSSTAVVKIIRTHAEKMASGWIYYSTNCNERML